VRTFVANSSSVRGAYSIGHLVLSNVFMSLGCCGHLKFRERQRANQPGLFHVIAFLHEPLRWNHVGCCAPGDVRAARVPQLMH
jgi:uncharacterized protein (DUF486 family)